MEGDIFMDKNRDPAHMQKNTGKYICRNSVKFASEKVFISFAATITGD